MGRKRRGSFRGIGGSFQGDKVGLMLMMHFGGVSESERCCESCADFSVGVCSGRGYDSAGALKCMTEHAKDAVFG